MADSEREQRSGAGEYESDDTRRTLTSVACGISTAQMRTWLKEYRQVDSDIPLIGMHYKNLLDKYQDTIDKDADGRFSASEVGSAILEHKHGGEIIELLTAVRWMSEGCTLDSQMLQRWLDDYNRHEQNDRIAGLLPHFDLIDADRNGYLSAEELEHSAVDTGMGVEERQSSLFAVQRIDHIQKLSNDEIGWEDDGITRDDLARIRVSNFDMDMLLRFRGARQRLNAVTGMPAELYASAKTPLQSIKPEAINQGTIGDCYVLSALAALAATDPNCISAMIRQHGVGPDAKYTVVFPTKEVAIDAPGLGERSLFASGYYGVWPGVLEKAYGKLQEERSGELAESCLPQDKLANGGSVEEVLEDFTGNSFRTVRELDDTLKGTLTNLSRTKQPMAAATQLRTESGIVPGHAYTVINYDQERDSIVLRNPWGRGEPTKADGSPIDGVDDGVFSMAFEQFRRSFSYVVIPE